ncbi:MAG: C_GCAxxG_C_C family protein [Clostridia bacterium]|nr:C_GCAxxG_C_C family protein [Clostridia bacterium]
MTRAELAKNYFENGYNCCQAVAIAFEDLIGIDRNLLLKLCSSFGGGFGRLREVCGAFSGISMVIGAVCGYSQDSGDTKMAHYALVRELAERFKNLNGGSIICKELIAGTEKLSSENPSVRTEEYKKKRPCYDIVKNAALILEDYFKEKSII